MLNDDQETIHKVLAGDSAAFAELVTKYQRRLLGLLMHACGDRELAEDMAQETFARAYQKLSLFSGESQFFTWLARVALNLLSSDRRRKRVENQVQREGLEPVVDSVGSINLPEDEVNLAETQAAVHQAIQLLAEERRQVILLRDFDGMDYDAISETLEIPVGTVRSRLHRARLDLKTSLQSRAAELGLSGS